VEREHRHLDREAHEERQEDPELKLGWNLRRDPVQHRHLEGWCVAESGQSDRGQTGAVEEVECQDADQHQHRADQCVEEELDRRVQLARPAPDPDQEVHRDQHDLPEHVEQDEIQRAENPQHPGLEEQQEDVVLLLAVGDGAERAVHRDEPEQGGQHDQQDGEAVDSEDVLDAH
jgi:hypothetical protein